MAINQRFLYFFAGDALDTDVWNKRDINGTNTFAMIDAVDGGYSILTDATADSRASLDFNNIRQYDFDASTFLCTMRTMIVNSNQLVAHGLVNDPTSDFGNTSNGVQVESATSTGFEVASSDGTTRTTTTMSLTHDTNYHNYKTVLSATNIVVDADGVLDTTKTTNLPDAKLQPRLLVTTGGAGGAREGRYLNYEAFNT